MAEDQDEGMAADGDKDQEKEVTEEKGRASEELDWEELRAQLFHTLLELEENREISLRYQEDYLELQDELCSVQEQTESLQEQRTLELRWAQEEVLLLQQSAEERLAAGGAVSAQHLRRTVQEYELEVTTLRAEIGVKSQSRDLKVAGDVRQLKDRVNTLTEQRAALSSSKVELMARVERLHKQADAAQDAALTSSVCSAEVEVLKVQLRQAQEKAEKVQDQCDRLKDQLTELQQSYDTTQQERELLEAELQHCRTELNHLVEHKTCTRPSGSPVLSLPFLGLVVMAALAWCWWAELVSAQSRTQSWNLVVGAVAMAALAIVIASLTRA